MRYGEAAVFPIARIQRCLENAHGSVGPAAARRIMENERARLVSEQSPILARCSQGRTAAILRHLVASAATRTLLKLWTS